MCLYSHSLASGVGELAVSATANLPQHLLGHLTEVSMATGMVGQHHSAPGNHSIDYPQSVARHEGATGVDQRGRRTDESVVGIRHTVILCGTQKL